jgi:carbon starvation protein CstA
MTLFFKKQDLDFAIGLTMTIMLVMYTMYQSISSSLPQTAYLKFIDYWLMFCLMVPFFVFVVQVLMKMEIINTSKVEGKNASKPGNIKSFYSNI